jgi:hypothetical protein
MAYHIAFSTAIRRQIESLPGHVKAIAKQEIAGLSDNPRPAEAISLSENPSKIRLSFQCIRSGVTQIWPQGES